MNDVTAIFQAVQSFGNWVLFFWLFVQSQKSVAEARAEHMRDLRRIARIASPSDDPNNQT